MYAEHRTIAEAFTRPSGYATMARSRSSVQGGGTSVTPSGLFRLSGLALVLAASMLAVAEVLAFAIFAQQEEDYNLQQIARTSTFFQFLLTLFAGALLLGGM